MTKPNYTVTEATIADLRGQPEGRNARRHSPRNIGMIADSMNEVGAARSVVVDENNDMLAGSGSLEGAAQAGIERVLIVDTDGETLVAVRRSGLSEQQKVRLSIADNRAAELAEWDSGVMTTLLHEGTLEGFYTPDEAEKLLTSFQDQEPREWETGDGGDDYEVKPPIVPVSRPGELYQIGEHYLLCGDSTDPGDVSALFRTERAEMVWTDPPYGVGIGNKNKYLNSFQKANRVEENLVNDLLSEDALRSLLTDSFMLALEHQLPGGAWYVTAPDGPLHIVFGQVLNELGIYHQSLIWVKHNSTFAPLGQDYHWKHEPMFYGWQQGAAHRYYGGRSQDSVWEIDRPTKSPEHPTIKPVELVQRSIENSTRTGQLVYDPFAGSGTTLIAAQRAGRVSYLMEIDPVYCDVVLDRARAEGITPISLVGEAVLERSTP